MAFWATVSLGTRYMKIWPEEKILGALFPENRVKYFMKLAQLLLPPFIMLILVWAFVRGGGLKGVSLMFVLQNTWPMTLISVLFLLLIPLQGYYWFGRRAQLSLNAKQQSFYNDLCRKLERTPKTEPAMYDLAVVLKEGLQRLDHEFLREL
ncbi:MAG: DUF412 family protein [Succinivibrio sp.]|nr:DUF412 family protein [Succinivibrio sp.]